MADESVVTDKLQHVNEYTSDVVVQRAVERAFMNLIQSCIDLAQHIRASEDLEPSGTAKQEIEALGNADIISRETQEKVEEAVGFRNVLAHRYGNVDHDAVYQTLHDDLVWFDQFQQEVARWFQQHRN